MMPRYAIYPGPVTSRADGQRHHVSADRLARLYGVDLRECLVVTTLDLSHPAMRAHCAAAEKLVALRPRYSGDYSLPAPAQLEQPHLRLPESPPPDGRLRLHAEKAFLVEAWWTCPACGHSQRGGPPAICPSAVGAPCPGARP